MRAARLRRRQTRDRGPEDAGRFDLAQRHLVRRHQQVGSLGVAVEVERKIVGRKHLAERHRRGQRGDAGDERVVHAESSQLTVHEPPEGVLAGAGDDGRAAPVTGCGDGDIGRTATEELAEGLDVLQAHADLMRIDVDPDASDGDDVESASRVRHETPSASLSHVPATAHPALWHSTCQEFVRT